LKDFEKAESIASVSIGSINGRKASFCAGGDILGWLSRINIIEAKLWTVQNWVPGWTPNYWDQF